MENNKEHVSYFEERVRKDLVDYPVVSLGWMMFVGMAMAYYWDTDWEKYSGMTDCYEQIRDMRGYDEIDDAVVEGLLGYTGEKKEKIVYMVARCASRVYSKLLHEKFEAGTEAAFGGVCGVSAPALSCGHGGGTECAWLSYDSSQR